MKKFISGLDISKHLTRHLVGVNHTHVHHKTVGVGIMIAGIAIVKYLSDVNFPLVGLAADVVGYSLHGIGLIPFVSGLDNKTI